MFASPIRGRSRSVPVWIISVTAGASLVLAPFWTGLLTGELTQACLSVPRLESDTSCYPDHRPLLFAALLLFIVQCGCIYRLIATAVKVARGEASHNSLAAGTALALSPLAVAALFTTSSDSMTSTALWVSLGMCLGAAAAAITAYVLHSIALRVALMGVCVLLLTQATVTVFAVVPATSLATGTVVAWAAALALNGRPTEAK